MVKKTKPKKDPGLAFAKEIAAHASKIKAHDIKILDLTKLKTFADYFVIATGMSDRQVEAIADSIVVGEKKKGRIPLGVEGYDHAQWIIVDYGDVIAHIFYQSMREIYSIEKLWSDARVIRYRQTRKKPAVSKKAK